MNRGRTLTTARVARCALACLLLAAPGALADEAAGSWSARPDLLTAPGAEGAPGASFAVVREGDRPAIRLSYRGRTIAAPLLPAGERFRLPLAGPVRLRDPWATFTELASWKPFGNLGWGLWGGRPATVRAAAPGAVLSRREHPVHGPVVEIEHGAGLRTRYLLNRHGSSTLLAGTRVAAGDPIGELGPGQPDDAPFVHFGILLDVGGGELVALDPSPFIFISPANRHTPFAASVLNAAVRSRDRDKVARLLELGLDPNRRAVDGTLPLEWAVMTGDPGLVRQLVAAGGDRNARTAERIGYPLEGYGLTIANSGPTIAECARESGDPELLAALAGDGSGTP